MRLRTNPDVRGPGRCILIRDWVKGVVNRSDRPTDRWMTEPRCWTNAPAAAPLKRTGYDRWSRGIHIGQCEPARRTVRRKRTETVTTGKWVKRPTSKETDRWGHNVHRTARFDVRRGVHYRPADHRKQFHIRVWPVEETRERLETVTVKNLGNLVFTTDLVEIVANVGIRIVK